MRVMTQQDGCLGCTQTSEQICCLMCGGSVGYSHCGKEMLMFLDQVCIALDLNKCIFFGCLWMGRLCCGVGGVKCELWMLDCCVGQHGQVLFSGQHVQQ